MMGPNPNLASDHCRQAFVTLALLLVSILIAACGTPRTPSVKPKVALAPAPYFDNKTGIYFPGQIGSLYRQPIIYLEEKSPGLGFAVSYRSDEAKIDIFVYDLGASVIPVGPDSKIAKQNFKDALENIRKATDRRIYSNFKLVDQTELVFAKQSFHYARVSYEENLLLKDSHLLLSGLNNQILKIRATINASSNFDFWRALDRIADAIAQSRRAGYGGITLYQLEDIERRLASLSLRDGLSESEAILIAQAELLEREYHNRFDVAQPALARNPHSGGFKIEFIAYEQSPPVSTPARIAFLVMSDGKTYLLNESI